MCSEAVLRRCSPERYSANMKEGHRRATIQKCDLNKTVCNFIRITPTH